MDRLDTTFMQALFTADYYRGYRGMDSYVVDAILRSLNRLELASYLSAKYRSVDDMHDRFEFHPQSRPFLGWAMSYLHQQGHVEKKGENLRLCNAGVVSPDSSGARRR